jgi:hypothetical protein
MIPYQVDPSLHPAEPAAQQLDDGFSPPRAADAEHKPAVPGTPVEPADPALWIKSDF